MERFIAVLLITLSFSSGCSKAPDGKPDNVTLEGRKIVLKADINNAVATRTAHSWSDEGLVTVWSDGDRVAVFNDKVAGGVPSLGFSLSSGAGTGSGEFTGTLSSDEPGRYYVVYPFAEGSRYDRIPFDMTAGQIHSGGMDDMTHLSTHGIMYGNFSEDGNGTVTKPLSFKHLTSAFKFNIVLPEAGKITLVQFRAKDNAQEPFVVKGTFDASFGTVDKGAALRSNSVCVYMDGTEALTEVSAVMMFIPVDIAGLTMEAVVTADGKTYAKEIVIPAGRELKAGVCYNLTVDCTAVTPTPVITVNAPGTLSAKLSGMKDVTELKINTAPGIELSAADFKAVSGATKLKSLDLSGIANKTLPGASSASYFTNITSIILPASLETIGRYAFCQSAVKGTFVIPASVTAIEDYAFQQCPNLTAVVFADRSAPLATGIYVFEGCANLAGEIVFPAQLVNIGDYMFSNCARLTSLKFAAFVKPVVIGASAFQRCTALTSLTVPAMVTELGQSAFSGCTGAMTLVFEKRTEPLKIARSAFRYNSGLSGKLAMPETVTEIANYAFSDCSYNIASDKTSGIYFSSGTPPVVSGSNSIYSQRIFVATEELKLVYEADASWQAAIPYFKDGKLYVGTIE